MKKISNTSILVFLTLSLSGLIGGYLLNGYLARHLSIYIYADYSIALKFLDLLTCIILFGTDVSSVAYLSKYLLNRQEDGLEDYVLWNVKLVSINILIAKILAWVVFMLMLILHLYGIRDLENYSILVFVIWVTPFAALFKLVSSFLTGFDLPITSMFLSNTLFYLIQLLFFAALLSIFKISIGYTVIALVLAGSYIILTIIASFYLPKNIFALIEHGLKRFFVTPIVKTIWFFPILKIILNSIIFTLISGIDLFIVKYISPNPKDAGCYAALLSIVAFFNLVPKNLYQELKPSLSYELLSRKGRQSVQKKINQINKVVFTILSLSAMLIIYFSKTLLGYFGPEYLRAQTALVFMLIGLWYAGLNQFSPIILIYANHEEIALRASLLQIIFVILITIPATYFYGMNGTALTTGLAFALHSLYCSLDVKRRLGIVNMMIPGYISPSLPR